MNIKYEDFIGIYENVYPEGYCQHLINEFERLKGAGAGSNRQRGEGAKAHDKNDYQIGLNIKNHNAEPFQDKNVVDFFFAGLQSCYENYTEKFSVLSNGNVRATVMKMQRTSSGGGYHVWHGEQGNGEHANRVLVYMLYLNTLPAKNCGETEFLYQQKRYNPTENTMILWPASYTHAHRGNPVYGDDAKYIVTGWFYYD
jgi:hypothetical protein